MTEAVLREKIARLCFQYCYLIDNKEIGKFWEQSLEKEKWFDCAVQTLDLIKEAGWFQEEAELVGRLLDRGWVPPEEIRMKRWVKLADDQSLPPNPFHSSESALELSAYNGFQLALTKMRDWRKILT